MMPMRPIRPLLVSHDDRALLVVPGTELPHPRTADRTRPRAEQPALHRRPDRFLPPYLETLTSGRVVIATRNRTGPKASTYGRRLRGDELGEFRNALARA
jgi:hypothetical protein